MIIVFYFSAEYLTITESLIELQTESQDSTFSTHTDGNLNFEISDP